MRLKTILAGLVGVALASGPAFAQFPDKPIRIMAPYAPGGNIDVTARIIADKLKDVLGVTVLVENKAGASGMIGSDIVARSAPDGYTLLVSANSLVAVPAIYGNAPYDWRTAFRRSATSRRVPAVLVVHAELADQDPGRLHRARPRTASSPVANSGIGTTNHIAIELIGDATGTKYTLVHYKGSGRRQHRRDRGPGAGPGRPGQRRHRPYQGAASCAPSPSRPTSACRSCPTCRP